MSPRQGWPRAGPAARREMPAPSLRKKASGGQREGGRDGGGCRAYVDRVGPKYVDPVLTEFREVGPISEEIDVYMDWGKDELFEVIRGEGECAL